MNSEWFTRTALNFPGINKQENCVDENVEVWRIVKL